MMEKKKILRIAFIIFMLIICFFIIIFNRKANMESGKEEIQLQIKLNLKEDIGLLILDYCINDKKGSGGIANANKSLLKRDELLHESFSRNDDIVIKEEVLVTIGFRIIIKYLEPNYENIYPEKYTKTMNEISFKAQYGQSYFVLITGDNINGYRASINGV